MKFKNAETTPDFKTVFFVINTKLQLNNSLKNRVVKQMRKCAQIYNIAQLIG